MFVNDFAPERLC